MLEDCWFGLITSPKLIKITLHLLLHPFVYRQMRELLLLNLNFFHAFLFKFISRMLILILLLFLLLLLILFLIIIFNMNHINIHTFGFTFAFSTHPCYKLLRLGVANRIVVVESNLKSEFDCRFQSDSKSNDESEFDDCGFNLNLIFLIAVSNP